LVKEEVKSWNRLWEPKELREGTERSRNEWEAFVKGPIWSALLWEMKDREDYLVEQFKDKNCQMSPEEIRGKLDELDFFRQIPKSLVASIIIQEANKAITKEKE